MEIRYSLENIDTVAQQLYDLKDSCSVYTFTGLLGAGKTTFIKQLLKKFGVQGEVTSPTFTYLIQYKNVEGQKFYHYDLYRLDTLSKFVDAGLDEYLFQKNSWSFIEWPEILTPLLVTKVCDVTIDYQNDKERIVRYKIR